MKNCPIFCTSIPSGGTNGNNVATFGISRLYCSLQLLIRTRGRQTFVFRLDLCSMTRVVGSVSCIFPSTNNSTGQHMFSMCRMCAHIWAMKRELVKMPYYEEYAPKINICMPDYDCTLQQLVGHSPTDGSCAPLTPQSANAMLNDWDDLILLLL